MNFEPKYKTGVLWQDLQHKELINLFKKLSDQDLMSSDPGLYTYTVGFLVMYASQHLSLEEGYMEHYNYPDYDHHKKIHKEFINKIKDFRNKYKIYSPEAASTLLENIRSWIFNHIIENDKKLGEFIAQKENSNNK